MSFSSEQQFDVLIVGGGIIGLSVARELRRNGVERVAVFERKHLFGNEASYAAAGMLAPQAEANQADDFFRLCQASRDLYPNLAAELFEQSRIDVRLDQTGTLYLAFSENDLTELEHRFAWQRAAGLPVEKLTPKQVFEREWRVSRQVSGALFFPFDWQVENRNLADSLRDVCQTHNVQLQKETKVEKVLFKNNRVIGVKTPKGDFSAQNVVIASGAWASQIKTLATASPSVSVIPIRGQMFSLVPAENIFRHIIYSSKGYLVPRSNNRILIGATVEDVGFDKAVTTKGLFSLLQLMFEIAPNLNLTMFDTWAGLRPKTSDGLPLLGEYPKDSGLYWATGHYRNGILLAPITGKLIAEKIAHNTDSKYLQIFNPARFQN